MKQALLNELEATKLVVKEGRAILHLKFNEIKWFKTEGNYTIIFLQNNKTRMSRISLLELQKQLPIKQFVRIHKSYMINKRYVNEIRTTRVLIDNEELPIGRSYQQMVTAFFKQ